MNAATTLTEAHLNIGSNIGDSRVIIGRAVAELASAPGVELIDMSQYVESEPWGFESPNRFVNRGVLIATSLAPTELLDLTQHIEQRLGGGPHRNPDGSYRDRALDIDIITYGNLTIDTPRLTLPHPRMHLRPFVKGPMLEIENRHPHTGERKK